MPVAPDASWLEEVRTALPALPAERRERLAARAGVAPVSVALVVERGLDDLVLSAIESGADAGRALTHAEHNLAVEGAAGLDPAAFARLVQLETGGRLTATQAKVVLAELVGRGGDPEAIAREKGFEAMAPDAVATLVDELIAEFPAEAERLRGGDQKLVGFFVGKAMERTDRKADGKAVTALLRDRLG